MNMSRIVYASLIALTLLGICLTVPALSLAYGSQGHKWGIQQFSSQASEKYGVRGWFKTNSPYIYSVDHNFSDSTLWIVVEVDADGP